MRARRSSSRRPAGRWLVWSLRLSNRSGAPGSARGELVVGLEFDEALPEEALEDFEQQ
jgi:hypothetical protein